MKVLYSYHVGSLVVVPGRKRVNTVIWRGSVPGPDGYPTSVYQLDDGHWDCYYEEELRLFGRPDN